MNRTTFGKKTLNNQRPRVDRFVAPREQLPDLSRKVKWDGREGTDDEWCMKYRQQKKYANYLDTAFDLKPFRQETSSEKERKDTVQPWPCRPRKKTYLCTADSILDLPSYSFAPFADLLDWSRDNILVAALGKNYHKWSWQTQGQISQGYTDYIIQCCKFDPKGKLLLLGTGAKYVEIHNTKLSKRVGRGKCPCTHQPPRYCAITAVDWSPTANTFVTGCSRGMLVSFTRGGNAINWCTASRGVIFIVRVSPDARYVTATALNEEDVLMLTWPRLQLLSSLKSEWKVTALSWHPWRSALLGIGAVTSSLNARVVLWDAPSGKLGRRTLDRDHFNLDAMLFSKSTGEMVLSMWKMDIETASPTTTGQLVVMSDLDTVVDQWGEGRTGLDRVRTMVFNPEGTKLATATEDEDLIIWNFLPEDKHSKKKKTCKRFCAMPFYLDKFTGGVSFR